MRIATWNVNSIRARLPVVTRWLKESAPDVALLQELKTEEANFPAEAIEELGYNIAIVGQKSYNGVAILSKSPIDDPTDRLPGDDEDMQARYIEAVIDGIRVASIYLPNGNPVMNGGGFSEKYSFKLTWMRRLAIHAQHLLSFEEPVVLGGDYNVIPAPKDCHDPKAWEGDALFMPETRQAWRALLNQGWTEAFRALNGEAHKYTFWDYQAGAWQQDKGIRIDHFLLSPLAADRLSACEIDREPRGWEKASDHTPVVLTLS